MTAQRADRFTAFHRLHESGCFVMPNPWDIGSARLLASLGFPALATTSDAPAQVLIERLVARRRVRSIAPIRPVEEQ